MRQVKFNPDTDLTPEQKQWWDDWIERAGNAREALIAGYQATGELNFNSDIWGDLKKFLLENVFYGKCAYCETRITAGFYGDAEHFRPKAKVTRRANEAVMTIQVAGKPHPGYYWLAYDWQNLFPACERCNSGDGKMNQFPVAGSYVADPTTALDIDTLNIIEQPLLLNPYHDDPAQYIHFIDKGEVIVVNESQRGKESIRTFKLDRPMTVTDRSERQGMALDRFTLALGEAFRNGKSIDDAMAMFTGPNAPYSQAVKDYLKEKTPKVISDVLRFLNL